MEICVWELQKCYLQDFVLFSLTNTINNPFRGTNYKICGSFFVPYAIVGVSILVTEPVEVPINNNGRNINSKPYNWFTRTGVFGFLLSAIVGVSILATEPAEVTTNSNKYSMGRIYGKKLYVNGTVNRTSEISVFFDDTEYRQGFGRK